MIQNTKNKKIEDLDNDIINHHLYQKTIDETDPDTISNNIIIIINDIYNKYAPIKKIKIKQNWKKQNIKTNTIINRWKE